MGFDCSGIVLGSSPLARGTLPGSVNHCGANGLIPAGAGQTLSGLMLSQSRWRGYFGRLNLRRLGVELHPGLVDPSHEGVC